MDIINYLIDLIGKEYCVNIIIAICFINGYALFIYLKPDGLSPEAKNEMLVLFHFLKNNPPNNSDKPWNEKIGDIKKDQNNDLYHDEPLPIKVIIILLLALILFFAAPLTLNYFNKKVKEHNIHKDIHPSVRAQLLIQSLGAIISNIIIMFIILIYMKNPDTTSMNVYTGGVIIILSFLILFSISLSIHAIYLSIKHQIEWNKFWGDELEKRIDFAAETNNHQLFNHGKILHTYIQNQSVIPLTSSHKVLVTIFFLIQLGTPVVINIMTDKTPLNQAVSSPDEVCVNRGMKQSSSSRRF